jgi:hypothetical protein
MSISQPQHHHPEQAHPCRSPYTGKKYIGLSMAQRRAEQAKSKQLLQMGKQAKMVWLYTLHLTLLKNLASDLHT